jgi:hypothetical protein
MRAQNLSPRAAAISFDTATPAPALRCNAPRGAREQAQCDAAESEARANAAQNTLSSDLRAVAKAVPHLAPRERPELRARSDGSYDYAGHVFDALVRADGSVAFADNVERAQLGPTYTQLTVVADVNDIVEKHVLGRELYSAEKQWFLDQTRELRAELSARFRAREQQQARRALEVALQKIVEDASSTLQQKHAAIFALWLDCGEDDDARAHRQAVEAFVRRYLQQGSSLGFGQSEIEQLNGQRRGLQQFQPYAGTHG